MTASSQLADKVGQGQYPPMSISVSPLRRFASHLALGACLIGGAAVASPRPLLAVELSGILIFPCAPTNDPDECIFDSNSSTAWHTVAHDSAAPIVALSGLLPGNALAAPLNRGGDLAYPLHSGKQLLTCLWQPLAAPFPPRLGVNLYFNGDQLTPGITAVVPTWSGMALTQFRANLSANAPSLFLRETDGPASLTYSDTQSIVDLTALLAAPPNGFARIDRTGLHAMAPDRALDAVLLLELTVTAADWSRSGTRPAFGSGAVGAAPGVVVGGPAATTDSSTATKATVDTTPTPPPGSPSPAATRSRRTPTPGSQTPAATTPTPNQSTTPGTTPSAATSRTPSTGA